MLWDFELLIIFGNTCLRDSSATTDSRLPLPLRLFGAVPGSLSDDEYKRVTAYILKLNGFPAGADPLPADTSALKLIRIAMPSDTAKPPRTR